jgi:hypothetical protein
MRDEAEVRQAIAILGASFVGPAMRRFIWGSFEQERREAWAMFHALGWVVGADDTDFNITLKYVAMKIQQYGEQELEKNHARS